MGSPLHKILAIWRSSTEQNCKSTITALQYAPIHLFLMASAYSLWSVLSFTSFFLCGLSLSVTMITLEEVVEACQSLISLFYLPEVPWLKLKQRIWENIRGSGRNLLAHFSLLFFPALKAIFFLFFIFISPWSFFFLNSANPEKRSSEKQNLFVTFGTWCSREFQSI